MPYPVSSPPPLTIVDVQETSVQEISVEDFNDQEPGNFSAPVIQAIDESSVLSTFLASAEATHVPFTVSRSGDAPIIDLVLSEPDLPTTTPGAAALGVPLTVGAGSDNADQPVESPEWVNAGSVNLDSSADPPEWVNAGSVNAGSVNAGSVNADNAEANNAEANETANDAETAGNVPPASNFIAPTGTAHLAPLPLFVELPPIAPVSETFFASTIPATQVPELTYVWNDEWVFVAQLPGEVPPLPEGERPVPEGEIPPLPPLPPVPVPPAGEILIIPGQESPEVEEAPDAAPDGQLPPVQPATQDIIELTADRQEYDEIRQVFLAEGNVELRFQDAILLSDRLQVNIPNRIAVADGDAALIRGAQVLRGDRITYNLTLDQGSIQQARGELFLPELTEDTSPGLPTDISPDRDVTRPLGDRLSSEQPLQVFGSPGGIIFGVDTPNQISGLPAPEGDISRLRYEADEIRFEGDEWEATNVRITNDPFSPPELELRSRFVTVRPLSPFQTEIRARNPRLVFDQGFNLPLFRERLVIDNRQRDSGLLTFGFDERDRGGLFIERSFQYDVGRIALLTLTPQILVQRAIDEEGFLDPSSYGLLVRLDASPLPGTSFDGNITFTSLDFGADNFSDTYRASVRANQSLFDHNLALEYSYRDRLFNGSLGFQNVQSSVGFVITSPIVLLGETGISLSYQGGIQAINSDINVERAFGVDADPDDAQQLRELLPDPDPVTGIRPNNRISLARYQASASLNRSFLLWSQPPLPPTPDQGLRYTPNPVVPFLRLNLGLRGTVSAYGNGDTQSVLTGTVGLSGQFGNFSRPFFDYTGINLSYSYNAVGGETPFNFDRVNDIQVLSVGLVQQIYGPFRLGIRSNIYLESQTERLNNTDTTFTLEYSRRTYSINLSYSPSREAGAINLRLNDFNWTGDPGRFSGLNGTVSGGIRTPGD
jgi:hypothetical protein